MRISRGEETTILAEQKLMGKLVTGCLDTVSNAALNCEQSRPDSSGCLGQAVIN